MLNGKIVAVIKETNLASIKVAEYAGLKFDLKKENILYYSIKK